MTYSIVIIITGDYMSFFDSLILDTILILFPIVCILIIKANYLNVNKVADESLMDIANFTSLFFLIKFCNTENPYMVLLVNMPFILSVLHNRKFASTIMALILILFNICIGTNPIFLIGEYFLYLIIFVFLFTKGVAISTILLTFVSIKGVFLTIYEYYVKGNTEIVTLLEIFICLVLFYLIGILVVNISSLIEKTVTLNQSLKELEKEKNLKNALFKITHEVKNPIAVCKGYLQMMDYTDIKKVKKYNDIILSELNRTLDIMDNFSQYTKIKVNLDIMDLDYLITDTIDSMSSIFRNKNIKVNYEENDEIFIMGDYFRLKQVFINVLKNSAEAMGNGGVIDINLKKLKKYIAISIKDNGCGISEDDLNKISELFYSSKEKGCGLGVNLSKEIINLHKGTIKYNSVLGEFTEVIIKLPYQSLH